MTQPAEPTNVWDSITSADEANAMSSITKMMTGTKILQDQPGVVYALAQQKAHPADAQAIDQFMQGLDAEKQVRLAQATGHKITMTDEFKAVLKPLGVDYSDVEYTHQDAVNAAADNLFKDSAGKLRAKKDADGNYVIDNQGQLVPESTEAPQKHEKHKGLGRLWNTLTNDVFDPIGRDVLKPVGDGMAKGYNAFTSGVSDEFHAVTGSGQDMASAQAGHVAGGGDAQVGGASSRAAASRDADMRAQGYDPENPFSVLAFQASGHAHSDMTDLVAQWDQDHPKGLLGWDGEQAVAEAVKFMDDPSKYRTEILSDATNYEQVGTQTVLKQDAADKLRALSSEQFQDLSKRVNAKTASVGNDVANAIGIDPVKHDTAYALTAAGSNLVASMMIDPTMVMFKAAKAAKMVRIGIDSLTDAKGAARVLSGNNEVTRGWQRGIDLAAGIRKANAEGDTVKVAALTAKFNAELPALSGIMDEFIGTKMLKPIEEWGVKYVNGKPITDPTFEAGAGITSMQDAVNYVGSRGGMLRLMNGRAANQASLMPGALSAVGLRKLKGLTAGWMTARAEARNLAGEREILSRAAADPALRTRLVTSGDLIEMQAKADDAVRVFDENVIAHKPFLNTRDEIRHTVGLLSERAAPLKDALAGYKSELDDLEERLQELHADKLAHPDAIAALHDQIQTGRELVDMHESALSTGSLKHLEDLQAEDARLAAGENAPQVGKQFGNAPIGKDVSADAADVNKGFNPALSPEVSYTLSYAGKGNMARNLRARGDVLGDAGRAHWFGPTAMAARTRLAAQRFTTLLPRNTMIELDDASSSDKIYKMALTYLNRGDANALRAAWNLGDGGQRKAIVSGLIDQIGHSAGLGQTETGQMILDNAKTGVESYSSTGEEILLDGQALALHAGQIRTSWVLPTFQAVQHAAANIGWWESTMGRVMTSTQADFLMSQWKLGALMKPNTVTRNQLEGWLRTALEGKFGDAIKAKAILTAPNRELWAKGLELESKAEYDALMAAGKTKAARELAGGSRLSGEILGRSLVTKRLAEFAPIALAARSYRLMLGKVMDEETVEAALTLGKDELAQVQHEYGQQIREADLGTARAARHANEVSKAGYGPARIKRAINEGARKGDKPGFKQVNWTQHDVDGTEGADRYEHALAMRVNATPGIAKAAHDILLSEARDGAEAWPERMDHLLAAMDDPAIADKMRLTGYGRVTWDDPSGAARLAKTDAEVLAGKREFANRVLNDYRHLLTGQDGQYSKELGRYIATEGKAPNAQWIAENLKNAQRPEGVMAPEVMAMANGGERGAIQALQDVEGGAYQYMVERPLMRTTSSPVFLANYAEARVGLNPVVKELIGHGLSEEAVNNMAKELSIKNAWIRTERLIDDPGQKTQFDVMARNMFPFSRATQAMIRRWGGGIWQDPIKARKMMLAYEGGVQSGFIYDNVYGEPTFTYPASGVLDSVMREVAKLPGLGNMAYFPLATDMTGGVAMAVPGADNPFRMSMGPMLSIPMREIFDQFPNHKDMLDQVDAFINGPIGVGETWSQAVPTLARRFYTAFDEGTRDTAFASAVMGAYANLAAAGMIPKPDASPSELATFRKRVEAQVHNQLIVRAVFGLLAPAAMSSPSEGTDATHADYAFHVSGIKQLSDEYKVILNETGEVARANAVWAALHPDEFVIKNNIPVPTVIFSGLTVAKSAASVSKVALPATADSLNWMSDHRDFLGKYATVGAYFLPMEPPGDAFNEQAYKTQKELGLRQAKTPKEFYEDVEVRNAESTYYPGVQGFHDRIDAAKAAGDTVMASNWSKAMSVWETNFKLKNPLFAKKLADFGPARAVAQGQLDDLKQMLLHGDVPDGQAELLSQLVGNYEGMVAFNQLHKGNDAQSRALRSGSLAMFNDWAKKNVEGTSLADLYSGVFRTLNTNLANVSGYGS